MTVTHTFPCNIGDEVWFIRPGKQKNAPAKAKPAIVEELIVTKNGIIVKAVPKSWNPYELQRRTIGVNAWLTRDEALQHLT